ncbi:putative multidrug resistance protein fnx1 [Golovinomyces cichoracearum]|uniref:Putative multidrug resistance protein fnx1 n=1 Tax=Golovinomyces cichoracearum TaxID=62708 RepID=A0A420JB97_9PEZI|nr:putative multidrug resistance protein fnx1 [Golovinomyces cichoracearum]
MEYPASNYFKIHASNTHYGKAFNQAREEALGDPSEQPTFLANIYFAKEDSLRESVCRTKKSGHRYQHGGYNTHGGNNKVLLPWQEEAIRQYCFKQWEAGNGANFSMVMSAITHLRAKMNPPLPAPTKRWFVSWLKKNPMLYSIHTKPISYARLDLHTEESVKEWFADLYKTVGEFEIDNGKKILNMDEFRARVGCPTGEIFIVTIEVKELYTASPENRKSVTIIETIRGDGKKTLPSYITARGKKIMDNWIASELEGDKGIDCLTTGYINNDIIMKYADHLIKYSHAERNKPWKLLLLDGHESDRYDPFVLKLAKNHIKAFWFPSHLTHILQPLYVGVFRPWKHFHNLCIKLPHGTWNLSKLSLPSFEILPKSGRRL